MWWVDANRKPLFYNSGPQVVGSMVPDSWNLGVCFGPLINAGNVPRTFPVGPW